MFKHFECTFNLRNLVNSYYYLTVKTFFNNSLPFKYSLLNNPVLCITQQPGK
jgi:hypothetical protein